VTLSTNRAKPGVTNTSLLVTLNSLTNNTLL